MADRVKLPGRLRRYARAERCRYFVSLAKPGVRFCEARGIDEYGILRALSSTLSLSLSLSPPSLSLSLSLSWRFSSLLDRDAPPDTRRVTLSDLSAEWFSNGSAARQNFYVDERKFPRTLRARHFHIRNQKLLLKIFLEKLLQFSRIIRRVKKEVKSLSIDIFGRIEREIPLFFLIFFVFSFFFECSFPIFKYIL